MNKKHIFLLIFLVLIGLISSVTVFGLTGYEYLAGNTTLYYSFNNMSGSNVIDQTGKWNATLPSTWTNITGKIGNGLSFDGSSGYLSSNFKNLSNHTTGTICMWTYTTAGSNKELVSYGVPSGSLDWQMRLGAETATPSVYYGVGDTTTYRSLASVAHNKTNLDQECVTWTSTNMSFYKNGALKDTTTSSAMLAATSSYIFWIGRSADSGNGYTPMGVDEFVVFSKNLSLTEIQFLYNSGSPNSSQQYPFTDGSSTPSDTTTITFFSQTPSNITNTNLFNYNSMNIQYLINKSNMIYSYLNYTTNSTNNYIEISNGTITRQGYSVINGTNIGDCVQENATNSTSCGGLNTGSYSTYNNWNDGNWATALSGFGNYNLYVNYTNPFGNSNNYIKFLTVGASSDSSFDLYCYNYSSNNFSKLLGYVNTWNNSVLVNNTMLVPADCNGTTIQLRYNLNVGGTGAAYLYEEQIIWNFGQNNLSSYNLFADNGVYPTNYWGYDQGVFSSTVHNFTQLSAANDFIKTEIYNMTSQNAGFFELMLNSTGNTRVIYCNSTYSIGNPLTNSNCFHFFTLSNISGFNHSHGVLSKHNLIPFTINSTGYLGTVKVTSNGYLLVNAQTGNFQLFNINRTTRTNTTRISTTGGSVWNSQTFTIDGHLHQVDTSPLSSFKYQSCAVNSSNTSCSDFRIDSIETTNFAPIVEILYPDDVNGINITGQFLNINWTYSLIGSANSINFNVSLLYPNLTVAKVLAVGLNNQVNLSYDIFTNNLSTGTYKLQLIGVDNNLFVSEDISENFTILYNGNITFTAKNILTNQNISNFSINLTDLNNSEVQFLSTNGNNITFNIVKNHTYNVFLDAVGYAYSQVNLTPQFRNQSYQFDIYTTNSIFFNIYYQKTGARILEQVDIQFTSDTQTFSYSTSNGSLFVSNITPANYTLQFSTPSGNYTTSNYNILVTNRTTQTFNAYLLKTSDSVTVQLYVLTTAQNPIDALVNIERLINSTYVTVDQKSTDSQGLAVFFLESGIDYKVTITADGYVTKVSNPQSFYPFVNNGIYKFFLTTTTTTNFIPISNYISYALSPSQALINSTLITFSNHVTSPIGYIGWSSINCTSQGSFTVSNFTNSTGNSNDLTPTIDLNLNGFTGIVNCNYAICTNDNNCTIINFPYYTNKDYNISPNNFQNSVNSFKNEVSPVWLAILAVFIVLIACVFMYKLSGGNPVVSTVTGIIATIFFAIIGWYDWTITFFIAAIGIIIYFFNSGGN